MFRFIIGCVTSILVGAVGICHENRADAQVQDPEEVIRRLGGSLTRDDKSVDRPIVAVNLSRRLPTLSSVASGTATFYPAATDADVRILRALEKLEKLDLSDAFVTDRGLKDIGAIKSLMVLNLSNTRITDAGLVELKSPGLEELRG